MTSRRFRLGVQLQTQVWINPFLAGDLHLPVLIPSSSQDGFKKKSLRKPETLMVIIIIDYRKSPERLQRHDMTIHEVK